MCEISTSGNYMLDVQFHVHGLHYTQFTYIFLELRSRTRLAFTFCYGETEQYWYISRTICQHVFVFSSSVENWHRWVEWNVLNECEPSVKSMSTLNTCSTSGKVEIAINRSTAMRQFRAVWREVACSILGTIEKAAWKKSMLVVASLLYTYLPLSVAYWFRFNGEALCEESRAIEHLLLCLFAHH